MPARKPVRKPAPKKPVRRPVRKAPAWRSGGVATGANIRSQTFQARVLRPGIDVVRETGFNVRSRKVGPKKRVVTI